VDEDIASSRAAAVVRLSAKVKAGNVCDRIASSQSFQTICFAVGADWHGEEPPPCRIQTESSFRPSSALSARWFCLPILFH
jgi:hypothetical protein